MSSNLTSSVFYAESYHPIQAGSIDGTDVLPHDNAVLRAHLCSSASLYDPFGDRNVTGDPHCTLFIARLSHQTSEHTLLKAMSMYGRVKNLRLVRHIVTGASRGYAFVEYETEREMRRAYKESHHSIIDNCEIMVDYNRQQLMPGWIPRRLGGGFGGKKESGQLRFGGRERPFRAPLRPIPYDELKRLGIPPPPEGKYMSRYQEPSPPRKEKCAEDREDGSNTIRSTESYKKHHKRSPDGREERRHTKRSLDREDHSYNKTARSSMERDRSSSVSIERSEHYHKSKSSGYSDRNEKHIHKRHKSRQRDRSHGTANDTEDRW